MTLKYYTLRKILHYIWYNKFTKEIPDTEEIKEKELVDKSDISNLLNILIWTQNLQHQQQNQS